MENTTDLKELRARLKQRLDYLPKVLAYQYVVPFPKAGTAKSTEEYFSSIRPSLMVDVRLGVSEFLRQYTPHLEMIPSDQISLSRGVFHPATSLVVRTNEWGLGDPHPIVVGVLNHHDYLVVDKRSQSLSVVDGALFERLFVRAVGSELSREGLVEPECYITREDYEQHIYGLELEIVNLNHTRIHS